MFSYVFHVSFRGQFGVVFCIDFEFELQAHFFENSGFPYVKTLLFTNSYVKDCAILHQTKIDLDYSKLTANLSKNIKNHL